VEYHFVALLPQLFAVFPGYSDFLSAKTPKFIGAVKALQLRRSVTFTGFTRIFSAMETGVIFSPCIILRQS
jgi:hypothetical protein